MLWKSPSEGARGCVSTGSLPLPKVLPGCITLHLSTTEDVHIHAVYLGPWCGRPHVAELPGLWGAGRRWWEKAVLLVTKLPSEQSLEDEQVVKDFDVSCSVTQ